MAQIFDTSQGLLQKIELSRLLADLALERGDAGLVFVAALDAWLAARAPARTGEGVIAVALQLRRPFLQPWRV